MTFQQRFGEFRKQAHAAGFTAREWAQIQHVRTLQISIKYGSKYGHIALSALMEKLTEQQKAKLQEMAQWTI